MTLMLQNDIPEELYDLPGFENYKITKDGRLWSKKTRKWLASFGNPKTYVLWKDGVCMQRSQNTLLRILDAGVAEHIPTLNEVADFTKPIPRFPNYRITRDGKVWSEPRRHTKGGWLSVSRNRSGYLCVVLHQDKQMVKIGIHRLVALTYLGDPPEQKPFVCHKDDNQDNNDFENLYWGDHQDNVADAIRNKRILTRCQYQDALRKLRENNS